MKLDSEQSVCHGTIAHKANSKSYDNSSADFMMLKSGKVDEKENHFGALEDREGDANGFANEMSYENSQNRTSSKLDFSKGVEEKGVQDFETVLSSTHSSLKMESFEDSVFYMDKSVMERELSELMVCYEENTYHVVKDICIDEGVPSKGKFWFDTRVDDKNASMLLPPEKHVNNELVSEKVDINELVSEKVDIDTPVQEVLKPSTEKELDSHSPLPELETCSQEKNYRSLDSVCNKSMPTIEAKVYATKNIASDTSKVILSLGDLLSMPELDTETSHMRSTKNNINEVEQQSLQGQTENEEPTASACEEFSNDRVGVISETPSVSRGEVEHVLTEANLEPSAQGSAAEESGIVKKEAGLESHSLDSVSEDYTNGIADKSSDNTNVENQNTAYDLEPHEATSNGKKECPQNGNSEHLDTRNTASKTEGTNSASASSRFQYNHMESSFSSAVPVSGLITYSGPIAYSGSLSLRSDSSTTSTRSFAFPVLQSEWNSSPVRMAKADRRNLRRHRNWMHSLLCCRF